MPTRTKGVLLVILAILLSIAVWIPIHTPEPPAVAPSSHSTEAPLERSKTSPRDQQEPGTRSTLTTDSGALTKTLEIEIVDGTTGELIPDAVVTWYDRHGEDPPQSTRSDTQGRALVTTSDWSLRILVKSKGMFGRYASDNLSLGRVIRVPMLENRSLEISVTDTNGMAVSDLVLHAHLMLMSFDSSDCIEFLGKTNSEGQLNLPLSSIEDFTQWAFWTGETSIFASGVAGAAPTIVPVTWSERTEHGIRGVVDITVKPKGWIEVEFDGEPGSAKQIRLMLGLASKRDRFGPQMLSKPARARFGPLPLRETWNLYLSSNYRRRLGNTKPDLQITGPVQSNQLVRHRLPIDLRRVLISGTFAPQGDEPKRSRLRAHIGNVTHSEFDVGANGEFEFPVWIHQKDGDLDQCRLSYGQWNMRHSHPFRIPHATNRIDLGRWEPQIDFPEFARLQVTLDGTQSPRCNIDLWSIDGGQEKKVHRFQAVSLGGGSFSLRGTAKPPYLVQAYFDDSTSPKIPFGNGANVAVAMTSKPRLRVEVLTDRRVASNQVRAYLDGASMDLHLEESDGRSNHYVYQSAPCTPEPHELRVQVLGENDPVWRLTTQAGRASLDLTGNKAVDLRSRVRAYAMHIANEDLKDLDLAWQIVDFDKQDSTLIGDTRDVVIATSSPSTRIIISLEGYLPWFGYPADGLEVKITPLTELSIHRSNTSSVRIRIRLVSTGLSADHREAARIISADDDWEEHSLMTIGQAVRFVGSYPPGAVLELQQLDSQGEPLTGTLAHQLTVNAIPKQIAILPW